MLEKVQRRAARVLGSLGLPASQSTTEPPKLVLLVDRQRRRIFTDMNHHHGDENTVKRHLKKKPQRGRRYHHQHKFSLLNSKHAFFIQTARDWNNMHPISPLPFLPCPCSIRTYHSIFTNVKSLQSSSLQIMCDDLIWGKTLRQDWFDDNNRNDKIILNKLLNVRFVAVI